jgi:diguanylate cyclase (GGDEF)-like protein/PAS domain S-box-containing protein
MNPPSLKGLKMKLDMLEKEVNLQRSVLEAIQEPFFILNPKGEFLKINPKGREILGYPLKELREMVFIDVVALEDLSQVRAGFDEMSEGKEVQFGIHIINRGGERIPTQFFGNTRKKAFFITLRDLRERIQMEEEWEREKRGFLEKIRERDQYAKELQALRNLHEKELKEIEKMKEEAVLLSYIDDLTGIYNHRFFIQQLALEIERQKRYSTPLSLLMIDIDYFKHYNDTNGHLAGDQALRAIAVLIQHGVRHADIIARYGGEEFSAILINTDKEGAKKIAERVRKNVAETRFPNEHLQPNGDLTVSIGVGTFSSSVATLTDLIREADKALYRAKRAGRNRVEG